jgi:ADP-ribose pyrophosphatase
MNDGTLSHMQKWKKISGKTLLVHPRLHVVEDQVALPDGATTSYLHFEDYKSAAMVLVIKDGKILVQHEYSYPPNKVMVQLPCGAIDEGEDPEAAANRELMEETGYTATRLELLGSYYMDNRHTDAKMYVYLATDVVPCEKSGGDPQEFIDPFWVPFASIPKDIASGKIDNITILVAWAFYMARQRQT